jgi:hypothetical protein
MNCLDSVSSDATSAVIKASQAAPAVLETDSKTDESVTLRAIPGAKYAKTSDNVAPVPGSGEWQDNPEFTSLSLSTTYYFFAYYPETATHEASPASVGLEVTTEAVHKAVSPVTPEQPDIDDITATGFIITNSYSTGDYGALEYQIKEETGSSYGDWVAYNAADGVTGLTPNTSYLVLVRYSGTDIYYASSSSAPATVATLKATLGGEVSIDGNAVFGQTLEANTSALTSTPSIADLGTLSYQWKRGNENINDATGNTYTIVQEDISKVISVTVKAENCLDSVSSEATAAVEKAIQAAPAAPVMGEKTDTSVTLQLIANAKYAKATTDVAPAIPDGEWQDSPEFTGLTPNTPYYFFAYYLETDTSKVSEASEGLEVTTDKTVSPAVPEQPVAGDATATDFKIANSYFTEDYGALEYRIKEETGDSYGEWVAYSVADGVTGLTPNTSYLVQVRYSGTDTYYASSPSSEATVATLKATLGGEVAIAGAAVFGGTLTAETSGLTSTSNVALGMLSYQWKRGSEAIIDATENSYIVVQEDISKNISVTVTAENCLGSVSSAATAAVEKATQSAPAAPEVSEKTETSITLSAAVGVQYSKDNASWQDSPVFAGLSPNTQYTFYAKLTESATHKESPVSSAAISTNPAAITISSQPESSSTFTYGEVSGSLCLTSTVTGGAALSYQWYSNTSESNEGGMPVSGATEACFTIPAALAAGTYYYYCTVSATGGATPIASRVASVTVSNRTPNAISGTENATVDIRIYPNPFVNEVHIKGAAGYTLRIFSPDGVLIHTPEVITSDEAIELAHLPEGIYLFRLDKDGKTRAIWGVKK